MPSGSFACPLQGAESIDHAFVTGLSKDDAFRLQEEVQKTTDRYISMVEGVYAEKEKEILEI